MDAVGQFRKKPIEVEAIQLTWTNWGRVCDFVPKPWFVRGTFLDKDGNPVTGGGYRFLENNQDLGLFLMTLNGEVLVRGNEWIIRGVNGEFYPCAPDVFEKTYERV